MGNNLFYFQRNGEKTKISHYYREKFKVMVNNVPTIQVNNKLFWRFPRSYFIENMIV